MSKKLHLFGAFVLATSLISSTMCPALLAKTPVTTAATATVSGTYFADSFDAGNFNYTISGIANEPNTYEVCVSGLSAQGASQTTITELPSTVTYEGTNYAVTAIGEEAFLAATQLALTSLPSTITSIGYNAFNRCTNLALTSLPEGITTIEDYTFSHCPNLALTSLPSTLEYVGSCAFSKCTGMTLTSLPDALRSMDEYAFEGVNTSTLTIGDNLDYVGRHALDDDSVVTVTSPEVQALLIQDLDLTTTPIYYWDGEAELVDGCVALINKNLTFTEDYTLPDYAALKVVNGAKLTISGATFTVESNSTLTIDSTSTLKLTNGASLVVYGELVTEEGAQINGSKYISYPEA